MSEEKKKKIATEIFSILNDKDISAEDRILKMREHLKEQDGDLNDKAPLNNDTQNTYDHKKIKAAALRNALLSNSDKNKEPEEKTEPAE